MTKYRIIDLFAGIGGLRLGFEKAAKRLSIDTECVFTSEIEKYCRITYQANFPETPAHIYGDITTIDPNTIPIHDILLAGFPCQPFSQAGKRNGFKDERGTLFFNIEKILSAKQPQAFLLENVKHLQGHDKGRTLKFMLDQLSALGYQVHYSVLNAKDFGLPQNRERLFIVGFRDISPSQQSSASSAKFNFPEPTNVSITLSQILSENVESKYTISDKLWAGHQRRKRDHINRGNGFGFRLFTKESSYVSTLSARYYKDGSEILIDQGLGLNPRKLTPRECARLQGFNDDFRIVVSDTNSSVIVFQLGVSAAFL